MPHSYAIAIYHFHDYAAADIPVLSVRSGIAAAKKQIVYYIIGFTAAALLLTVAGYTGYAYMSIAALTGFYWLYVALKGYSLDDDRLWARKMFILSIIGIMVLSSMMSLDFSLAHAK